MQRVCLGTPAVFVTIAILLAGCGKAKPTGAVAATVISNKLVAITAAGEPVTAEQLDSWYAEPPAGENAADIYEQAFAALSGDSGSPTFLAKNQNAIGLLIQAADRKACRYPIDLKNAFATRLPHLQQVKSSAQLLSIAADDAVTKGRADTAIRMTEANVSLARSLQDEPILISRLVASASLALAVQPIEQLLSHGPLTDDQLAELQQAFRDANGLVSYRSAFVGERTMMIAAFQATREQSKAMNADSETNTFDIDAYKKTDTYNADFNFTLDAANSLIAYADKEFPAALEFKAEKPDSKYVISQMVVPPMQNILVRPAETSARLRLVQTALAIERYRLAHADALPAGLSDLTPRLLPGNDGLDPFDGKPLRYKKLSNGYLLYSIGRDRKDDGGKRQTTNKNGTSGDITFTVTR